MRLKCVLNNAFKCVLMLHEILDNRDKGALYLSGIEASGCGSAWLERLVWDQEVAGSNPVTPIFHGYEPGGYGNGKGCGGVRSPTAFPVAVYMRRQCAPFLLCLCSHGTPLILRLSGDSMELPIDTNIVWNVLLKESSKVQWIKGIAEERS